MTETARKQAIKNRKGSLTKQASNFNAQEKTNPSKDSMPQKLLVNEVPGKKWSDWWQRVFYTILMFLGFLGFLLAGPTWMILLVIAIQVQIYREVISIAHVPTKEQNLPWFKALSWYFLFSTNYFLYGERCIFYLKRYSFAIFDVHYSFASMDGLFSLLISYHRFISLLLYCLGLILFVLTLQKGQYKFQFSHFGWTHMTLLIVVVQSRFIINNISDGLIWFLLPVLLVICNDSMAYIFGFFFGKTPLISISPKKTWEGFLGAFISTIIFGFLLAGFLAQFSYLTCHPVHSLSNTYFSHQGCDPNPVFIFQPYEFPSTGWPSVDFSLQFLFPRNEISVAPVQFHALILAAFASSIAPFGGFFASGIKRAFNIKDFGDSIPGHGGLTDRMDCQLLMGVFSNIYYQSFIRQGALLTATAVLKTAITKLSREEQLRLFDSLKNYLVSQGQEL